MKRPTHGWCADCGHIAGVHEPGCCLWPKCHCPGLLVRLTRRETEILMLMAHGKTVKDIACELNLSHRTVEVHQTNIYAKTGAHSHLEIVLGALREHLVELVDLPSFSVRIGISKVEIVTP